MPVFKPKGQRNYRIQFDINGRTYVKSSKTSDKRAAEKMEAQWRAKIHSQKMIGELEDITVEQMFQDYFARPHAETTLKNARAFHRLLQKEMDLDVFASEFEQVQLDKLIEKRLKTGIAQSTVRTQMLYFSGAWNQTNRKVYNVPDLEYTKLKQPKQKTEYVTPEQEDTLVEKLTTRKPHAAGTGDWQHEIHDVLVLLIDTGARYNEICLLDWDMIDLKKRRIELWRKKNEIESYINMTDYVYEVLLRRSKNKIHQKWVFTNWKRDNHRNFNTTYMNSVLHSMGITHTVHHIRHGFATKLLKKGMTLRELKELLGHKDIKTTMRYGHLEASDVSPKAVEILNEQNAARRK